MSNTVRIVGASVAGVAYALGRMVPLAFNAVSFLASAAALRAIHADFQQERVTARRSPRDLLADIGHGLSWLWRR